MPVEQPGEALDGFHRAIALEQVAPTTFAAQVPSGWDVAAATNGGLIAAMLAAAGRRATGGQDPITITLHFLAPVRPGPARIEVEVLRRGRRLRTAEARLLDASGTPLVAALMTMETLPAAGEPPGEALLMSGAPPELPDPQECPLLAPTDTMAPALMGQVAIRLAPAALGFATGNPDGSATMSGWFDLPDRPEHRPLDGLAVLLASDAFPPAVFNANLPVAWTPTVELTVQLRSLPRRGPLACTFRTRFVVGRSLEADGEIWDSAGGLVALSRQLALLPRG